MGVTRLAEICRKLVAHGASPDLPAAVIERATTDRHRVVSATLTTLPGEAAAAGVQPPALIMIGEVVRLRASLDWLGERSRPALAAA